MPGISFCRQPGLGVLRVSGRDARKFLHAQTTQQIDDLKPEETRLAAWLNAKGRVFALFDVVPEGDSFLLILPADSTGAVIAGLRRYVLRDDVRIEPAADRAVLSVSGRIDDWLDARGLALPRLGVATASDAILARTGERRVDLIVRAGSLPSLLAGIAEADPDTAALDAIAEGRPDIPLALADRYTPHMLGIQRNAVSFTKGCYPGQEIVTRTEHRGEAKRGIRRLKCSGGTRPVRDDAIVDAAGAQLGEVNRVAATDSGFEMLAIVGVAAERDALRLADGRVLAPLPI